MSEHRCVGAAEHNPQASKFHGCCAICLDPWPCEYMAGNEERERMARIDARATAIYSGMVENLNFRADRGVLAETWDVAYREAAEGENARIRFLSAASPQEPGNG